MKQALDLCGWHAEGISGNVCYKCDANTTDKPWTDPSHSARWRCAMVTRPLFLTMLAMKGTCEGIYNWPGFLHRSVWYRLDALRRPRSPCVLPW